MIHSTGNEPTREELAQEAGIPVERLAELNAYTKEPVLLDTTLSDEGNTESGDLIMDSDSPSPGVWSAPAPSSKAFNGTHSACDFRTRRSFRLGFCCSPDMGTAFG
ncbi:hypothetical protein OG520_38430 [Streptomyces sp. NBC_00984]|nr:hypothetical protein OG520_38430 [Streptomyces sp. NBC_00984]